MILKFLAQSDKLTHNDILYFCLFVGIGTFLLLLLDFYLIKNSGEN